MLNKEELLTVIGESNKKAEEAKNRKIEKKLFRQNKKEQEISDETAYLNDFLHFFHTRYEEVFGEKYKNPIRPVSEKECIKRPIKQLKETGMSVKDFFNGYSIEVGDQLI